MGRIFAIGGGEIGYQNTPIETIPIDTEIIKATDKEHPKLLFIPTASGDAQTYCDQIEIHFGDRLGCEVDHLLLSTDPSKEEILEKVETADIIYVGGGNTMKMMQIWRDNGLDTILKGAYANGKILAGLSAGAICWFEYGSSDSLKEDDPNEPYIIVEGLGLEKGLLTPHFNKEAGRPESQKELLEDLETYGIGIDERAALEIHDDKYRVISADESAKATISYWRDGDYHEQTEITDEYKSLEGLIR